MVKSCNSQYTAEYRYDAFKSGVSITIQVENRTSFMDGMAIHLLMSRMSKLPSIIYMRKIHLYRWYRRFMQKK
ncbi:hypothetical protein DSM30011_011825 [Acinetobacter baumannii]|nr:hypothetical protein DSM30011_011825 [Acinetobacter baumannii]